MSLRQKIGVVITGVILTIIGINSAVLAYEQNKEPIVYVDEEWVAQKEEVEEVVLIEVQPTALDLISDCESGIRNADGTAVKGSGRHYTDDGTVVIGQHTDPKYGIDVGEHQINTMFHLDRAKSLGIDIFSEEGNAKYARILFREQGGAPWVASYDCHGVK